LRQAWVEPDRRDEVVDFVGAWSAKTGVAVRRMVSWLGIGASKFYGWRVRYGRVNEHNGWIPRDHWLEEWEKEAIVRFWQAHPLEGYRRLTYLLLDADVVAASASSVYRVLSAAGLLERWNRTASKKGTGFTQPSEPHEHWHVDLAYLNLAGTFYYLCSVLDGYSRYIVHWDLRPAMKESDVELIVQEALERWPGVHPRVISDNGPQFVAKDFREFIRLSGLTHVRTSPFYPQSNGKLERWHQSFKVEGWRPGQAEDEEAARDLIARYVRRYNEARLHSAIGYVAPQDKLEGREQAIFAAREEKLARARARRAARRAKETQPAQGATIPTGDRAGVQGTAGFPRKEVLGSGPERKERGRSRAAPRRAPLPRTAGYPSASCSPAELASVSPAVVWDTVKAGAVKEPGPEPGSSLGAGGRCPFPTEA